MNYKVKLPANTLQFRCIPQARTIPSLLEFSTQSTEEGFSALKKKGKQKIHLVKMTKDSCGEKIFLVASCAEDTCLLTNGNLYLRLYFGPQMSFLKIQACKLDIWHEKSERKMYGVSLKIKLKIYPNHAGNKCFICY